MDAVLNLLLSAPWSAPLVVLGFSLAMLGLHWWAKRHPTAWEELS